MRATPGEGYVCSQCQLQVQLIQPPLCDQCGLPARGAVSQKFSCSNCKGFHWHFSRARSAVAAQGLVLDVLHRYKYQAQRWFEPFLANLLVQQAAPDIRSGGWDLIVPIPLHRDKLRKRQFNQADRLARHLGRAVGLPVDHRVLERNTDTDTQTRLSRGQRRANVRGAFHANPRPDLQHARIVVVDDVLTTGATSDACARALRAAGAGEVCVWTVARGLLT